MKCKEDKVIYLGKQKRALEWIQELELSRKLYYKKRNLGMNAQEAFEHCLVVKKKSESNKNRPVIAQISRENQIASKTIYKGLNEGKTIEEVICERKYEKQEDEKLLAELRKQGLPQKYKNLYDFCIKEGLNYNVIFQKIQNGENLYDAVRSSFNIGAGRNKKLFYHGISLKAICQKYHLNYAEINSIRKASGSIEYAIERNIFNQAFSKNLGRNANTLWEVFTRFFVTGNLENFPGKIEDSILNSFTLAYYQIQCIKRDFAYYQFLEEWDILFLKTDIVDERVKYVLEHTENVLDRFSLNELYFIFDFENGLMKDFEYVELNGKSEWLYNNVNHEVLRMLKIKEQ